MGEQIRCSCSHLNDRSRRYCGDCGSGLGRGCICGFPNSETDRFCGGCGGSTVIGRASSPDLRITTTTLQAIDEPTETGAIVEVHEEEEQEHASERRSIDEMTVLRRPASKTIANERALQFHEDTSTQRIEMMCDAVATDPQA